MRSGKRKPIDLSKKVEAQGRAIRALQRRVRMLSERVEVKPVDAIGFVFDRVVEDEEID